MSAATDPDLDERATNLRAELKQWEKQYADANAGRKAGREDVKRNIDIAQKYKEYNRLKDLLSGKTYASTSNKGSSAHPLPSSPLKRKRRRHDNSTPDRSKSPRLTPKRKKALEAVVEEEQQEDVEVSPSNVRTFVGPTPQKNGRVLGLFDFTPRKETPTKLMRKQVVEPTATRDIRADALGGISTNLITSTPRKSYQDPSAADIAGSPEHLLKTDSGDCESLSTPAHMHERTPQSIGKRNLFAIFARTPSKQDKGDDTSITPMRVGSRVNRFADAELGTPAFLRRGNSQQDCLAAIAEEDEFVPADHIKTMTSPTTTKQRKSQSRVQDRTGARRSTLGRLRSFSMGKPLSSMISDIREAEDARLDDDMNLLRELESGSNVIAHPKGKTEVGYEGNGQIPEPVGMLGPDGIGKTTDDELEATSKPTRETERPLRRKKGQKRQTRRFILRPVAQSRPKASEMVKKNMVTGPHAEQRDTPEPIVAETQLVQREDDYSGSEQSHSDFTDAEVDVSNKPGNLNKRSGSTSNSGGVKDSERDQRAEKKKRKISSTAHANFRRLKIRGKGGGKGNQKKWHGKRGSRR